MIGQKKYYFCLALAMYPVFLEANSVCGLLGACVQKSVVKAPTCDDRRIPSSQFLFPFY